MKRYIILALTTLLLALSTQHLEAQPAMRVVKGRVLDATTKTPLTGVLVSSAEVGGYSTLSTDDGTYELKIPVYVTSLQLSAPECNMTKIGLGADEQQRDALLDAAQVKYSPERLR